MKERPIIFSAPMVRAILEGRKTMTRRTVTPANSFFNGSAWPKWAKEALARNGFDWNAAYVDAGPSPAGNPGPYLHLPCTDVESGMADTVHRIYPRIQPGDRLWVRETWLLHSDDAPGDCLYRANHAGDDHIGPSHGGWKPSIHMPRWASRILIEVTEVRVERLQDISEVDAVAEGAECIEVGGETGVALSEWSHREGFIKLWKSINGPDSWDANPWVWVVSFKRIEGSTNDRD